MPENTHDDIPAAAPLIASVAGILAAAHLDHPLLTVCAVTGMAMLTLALRQRAWRARISLLLLVAACAIGAASHESTRILNERNAVSQADRDVFTTIDAPLARDWTERNGGGALLRVDSFHFQLRAKRIDVDAPLVIYLTGPPAPVGMRASVRAEGFLHVTDRGTYALSVKSPELITYGGALAAWTPGGLNRLISSRLRDLVRHDPAIAVPASLVEALALGRGEHLDQTVRDGFRRAGTYHLLVFSGMQIAFAAAALALLFRWMRAPRLADISLLAFALLAPLFIGGTASVTRASIAIALFALSRLAKRPTSIENLWALSAMIRLLTLPSELTDPAFQLTYAGAGAMLFLAKPIAARFQRGRGGRIIAYALAAELAVTPLTLLHFHQYALGGGLMTLVLTPLLAVMMTVAAAICGSVVICPPAATPLLHLMALLHHLCEYVNGLSVAPFRLSGYFTAPPVAMLVAAYAAALSTLLLPRRIRLPLLAFVLLAASASAIIRYDLARRVETPRVLALDVGQGDSLLVRDGTHAILVDGGGRADDTRFGESVLLPLLLDRGVRHLDAVILTHAHPDHCGGLPAVVADLDVGEVWLSPRRFRGECAERLLDAIHEARVPLHLVHDGDSGATFGEWRLFAFTASTTFRHSPENNASVVVRMQNVRWRVLLTGDIERDAEGELVERFGPLLRCDLLKIAHHGSRSSSTAGFLDAASPRLALISCGPHNLFHHPHPSTLEALAERRIVTERTDRGGTIEVEASHRDRRGGGMRVHREIDTPR